MPKRPYDSNAARPAGGSRRFIDRLFTPVDAASLIVIRVVFGVLVTARIVQLFVTREIDRLYLSQTVRLKYPLFEWLPDPAPDAFRAVFILAGIAALLMAFGFLYRWASITFLFCWSYAFFVDQTAYQNHDYLVCLFGFLFALMPLNRTFAIDAWLWPRIHQKVIPAWCVYLFRFQIAVVYFFGGIRKLNPDWMHGEPIRTMLHTEAFQHPNIGRFLLDEQLVSMFVWGGLLLDLLIVPALLIGRTRGPASIVLTAFHLTNAYLWDIDLFPWLMIAATLIFFPPDFPRRVLASVLRRKLPVPVAPPAGTAPRSGPRAILLVVLAVYAAIQLALPCRPFLYPGHPLEQPDLLQFSWNMMLRIGTTQARFSVVDAATGDTSEVSPDALLSAYQLGRLGSPNAVRSVARSISHQRRRQGDTVAVYARVRQSVHGRPWQVAIDPSVDLSRAPRVLGVTPWAIPFDTKYPPNASDRNEFDRAEWEFCKREGFLPLHKVAGDPAIAARIRAWEDTYLATHSGPASPAKPK